MTYLKYLKLSLLVFTIGLFMSEVSFCQCTSTILNPMANVKASSFNDTVIISTTSNAGEYFIIEKLSFGDTYIFSSSIATDYITIRDKGGLTLLAHGLSPLSYTIIGPDNISVHINLVSPSCGSDVVDRTTLAICTTCPSLPPKVEVGSSLDVSGGIKVGNVVGSPSAGMIQWNDVTSDFEGYNGLHWVSLTKPNANWGKVRSKVVVEDQKLTAGDGTASDFFGLTVSISGDYAVIGSHLDDIGGNTDQGSAYVFKRSGTSWTEEAKLTASDGEASDFFGRSVSISGDYVVIGCTYDDIDGNFNQGSAYVFKRSGTMWTEEAYLTAGDGAEADFFGISVSISGDYAVIGNFYDDVDMYTNQGSAYVFKRSGTSWNEEAKLIAGDGKASEFFGASVSISGDYAIVGAEYAEEGGNSNQGSAYIFVRNETTWTEEAKLLAQDGAAGDRFGVSVSISGDYAVIGSFYDDVDGNTDQGSAYIFIRNENIWTQQAQLTASDSSAGDLFGNYVCISGEYAVISCSYDDISNNGDQGSAYVFKRLGSSWIEEAQLTASDGEAGDQLSRSVSIDGDYIILGANYDEISGNVNQGSAYIFLHK